VVFINLDTASGFH